jgi:hypothetical protein
MFLQPGAMQVPLRLRSAVTPYSLNISLCRHVSIKKAPTKIKQSTSVIRRVQMDGVGVKRKSAIQDNFDLIAEVP